MYPSRFAIQKRILLKSVVSVDGVMRDAKLLYKRTINFPGVEI